MKNVLTTAATVLSVMMASAQTNGVKELTPTRIETLSFSTTEEANFNKWHELIQKEDRTKEENEFVKKGFDKYDETMYSYWETPPGSAACSWYCAGGPSKVLASSALKDQGGITYSGKNAHDFSYNKAWVEGVEGYGIGEYLLYKFPTNSPRVTKIIIANGYVKSMKTWKENSRVKKLLMYYNDKPYAILKLEDSCSEQYFVLGDTLGVIDYNLPMYNNDDKGMSLKFEILEVYKGDKYDDTAISELYFSGVDVHCLVAGTVIRMADGSGKNIESIRNGDAVLTYMPENGKFEASTVKNVVSARHSNLVTYSFESGNSITCTMDHPFMLSDKSWVSYSPEKTKVYSGFDSVRKVEISDKFMTTGNYEVLSGITVIDDEETTYTITLLDKGNTFVANGVVVGVESLK